jgi:hypothetical protein
VPVSPAVGQAVVRVVQEALANVNKHAPVHISRCVCSMRGTACELLSTMELLGRLETRAWPLPARGPGCTGCGAGSSCSVARSRPDPSLAAASRCGRGCLAYKRIGHRDPGRGGR